VIDVIDHTATVADFAQGTNHVEDVRGLTQLLEQALGFLIVTLAQILRVVQDARTLVVLAADRGG
jgi:hypothetical protein